MSQKMIDRITAVITEENLTRGQSLYVSQCADIVKEEMDTPTQKVLAEIAAERIKQTAKFGVQRLDAFRWCAILGEEYGEACQAAVQADSSEKKPQDLYRKELLHAAAVAVQAIKCYDRDGFFGAKSEQ